MLLIASNWAYANPALDSSEKAVMILDLAKKASGGAEWDKLTGSYEEGEHSGVKYKTWLVFTHYGMRVESQRGDATVMQGFNGQAAWKMGAPGDIELQTEPETIIEAITTAYVSSNGYFFPKRFPASFGYVGIETKDNRIYDIVTVMPDGGRAFELWFAQSTHLLGWIIDNHEPVSVRVKLADYRRVGSVLVPFKGTVFGPNGTVLDEGQVITAEHITLDSNLFDPPVNPE
jgi:hypothetical protein